MLHGDITQFEELSWEVQPGEHTITTGPNGAGKFTLLQLITGDHSQCYRNGLTVLARERGTGESVWEIKRQIGIVSHALHRGHRIQGNSLSVVVSGFFDSIGLYTKPTSTQLGRAAHWLEVLGLAEDATTVFQQLSWGQQRMVLIARGLIKQPPLLILDEPTQGRDDINRHLVLDLIERLVDLRRTTILFVSHRQDEHLPLFNHRVQFRPSQRDDVRFDIVHSHGGPF